MENKQPSVVDDDNEVSVGKTVIVVDTVLVDDPVYVDDAVNDSSDDERMKRTKKNINIYLISLKSLLSSLKTIPYRFLI